MCKYHKQAKLDKARAQAGVWMQEVGNQLQTEGRNKSCAKRSHTSYKHIGKYRVPTEYIYTYSHKA